MNVSEKTPTSVLTESHGSVRILTLNRPAKKNAADLEMQERLLSCLESVDVDADVRVLILTGAGGAFSAGGDREYLRQIAAGRLDQRESLARVHAATIRCMLRLSIPTIAAVSGPAVGYAAGLVAMCDMVVMGDNGFLCDPHVKFGIAATTATQLIWPAMLRLHQSTFSGLAAGVVRKRTGRYAEVYPLVVRPCRDGYVSLGVVTDEEFDRLAIAFGRPDLVSDERFSTREARGQHRDALDDELAPFLMSHDADEVVATLQANAVAATKVADTQQVLANPQLKYRQYWKTPTGAGDALMPGNPVPAATVYARSDRSSHRGLRACPPKRQRATAGLPLDGVVVLDFTAFWAGPSATACLGDLGADVIWVERPRSRIDFDAQIADPRVLAQFLYHQKMNRHKRSVVLDLGTSSGRAAARGLAGRADVLVENFRPGVVQRLGLAPSELCDAFPDLVYVSLSGFGSGGPWGEWRSFGPNIEAASSVMARTGYVDGEPLRLGHALPDGVGGIVGALAVLRGLRERDERGCGGWFDISQLEAYVAAGGEDILTASLTGASPSRLGNRSRAGAIQGVFPCKGDDQWIAIRLTGQTDLERFAALTRSEALAQAVTAFTTDHDEVDRLIAAYTSLRDKHELARVLQHAELEAFPAMTPPELVADAHLAERGFFIRFDLDQQSCLLPGTPLHSSGPLADPTGPAPHFSEHTSGVLEWLAGDSITK